MANNSSGQSGLFLHIWRSNSPNGSYAEVIAPNREENTLRRRRSTEVIASERTRLRVRPFRSVVALRFRRRRRLQIPPTFRSFLENVEAGRQQGAF